jgi:hypothetical protein
MKELLNENSTLKFDQEKWFKSLGHGSITIKDSLYTLKATSNKKDLIIKDGVIIGYEPFELQEGIIKSSSFTCLPPSLFSPITNLNIKIG